MGGRKAPALHRQLGAAQCSPWGQAHSPPWVQMGLKPVADSSEPTRELLLQAARGPSGQQDLVSCKALGSSSTCIPPLEGTRDAECSALTRDFPAQVIRMKRALRTFWKQFVSVCASSLSWIYYKIHVVSRAVSFTPCSLRDPTQGAGEGLRGQDLGLPPPTDPRPLSRGPLLSLLGFWEHPVLDRVLLQTESLKPTLSLSPGPPWERSRLPLRTPHHHPPTSSREMVPRGPQNRGVFRAKVMWCGSQA